jgi:hypothetical protein
LYHWNRTTTKTFSNVTERLPNIYIYPCFDTTWLLRDPSEIVADIADVKNMTTTAIVDHYRSNANEWWTNHGRFLRVDGFSFRRQSNIVRIGGVGEGGQAPLQDMNITNIAHRETGGSFRGPDIGEGLKIER